MATGGGNYRLGLDDRIVNVVAIILGLVLLVITFYPFYYVILFSLNEGVDSASGGLFLIPRAFTLTNYKVVLSDPFIGRSFVVTIFRTVMGTVMAVFFTAMVAYGLSKKHLMFRKTYSMLGLVTLYFGGGLIPTYLIYRTLGLLNTFWVYIIPSLFAYYHALLFMAFFRELPQSLEDSAKVDGAGDFLIFIRIILPLSKPVLATIALFVGVFHWNDWFTSAYFVFDQKLWTVPTILIKTLSSIEAFYKVASLQAQSGAHPDAGTITPEQLVTMDSMKWATIVVTVFPITVVYPFLQRYFVKGLLVGHIKA